MGSSKITLDFLDPPKQDGDLGALGHYRVIAQLGKGGMGFVFRAEDTRLKRQVALKVMNSKVAATPNSRARFISEARAMAAVHHDNVATIFEVGEHNKTPYMAMEMLKGGTLDEFKKAKTRPGFERIIDFAKEMARGLAAAHSQGIVHRDIKPANVWVEAETDRIKILDFGLALASTPVDQLAGRGAVIGTPGYLAPEQARSEPLDDRCDLYSMGVVLYELATGKLPLQNKSVAGQLIAILAQKPKPLRDLNADIPQPLADLIHKLLSKEPHNRYSSAVQLESELNRVAEECESKTEVAAAISMLQSGLDAIVNKKESPDEDVLSAPKAEAAIAPAVPVDLPDPFASIPDSPLESPSGVHSTSPGGTSGFGVRAAPANPYAKNTQATNGSMRRPTKKAAAASPMAKFWPLAVAGTLAVIAIPVGAYFAFLKDSDQQASVIRDPDPAIQAETNTNTPSAASKSTATNTTPVSRSNVAPPNKQTQTQKSATGRKKNNNTNAKSVEAKSITTAEAPGAITLLSQSKGNGSFEKQSSGAPVVGSNQAKKKLPGWTLTLRGQRAGVTNFERNVASDGRFYVFADKASAVELSSNTFPHVTQPGDVFRLVFDVSGAASEGNRKAQTKYATILGFKKGKNGAASRWKLGEVQDNTLSKDGVKTIGFQYTATSEDAGKNPFIRLVMSEWTGKRSQSYLDNVRLTVVSPSSMAMADNNNPTTRSAPPAVASMDQSVSVAAANMTPAPAPTLTRLDTPDPPEPNNSPGKTVNITTRDEPLGADAYVKKSASVRNTFGTKPNIAIQTRGDIQLQHSYVRFDLSTVSSDSGNNNGENGGRQQFNQRNNNGPKRETGKVTLRIDPIGSQSAVGASIFVYGTNDAASEVWQESGRNSIGWSNSYSKAGLNGKLPLLAEITVPKDVEGSAPVEIASEQLSNFIREAPRSSVTLVLAGGLPNNQPLQFASRESSTGDPPTLIIEIPTN